MPVIKTILKTRLILIKVKKTNIAITIKEAK